MDSNNPEALSPEARDHKHCCRRRWKIPFFIAGMVLIKSALVMLLWNYLVPDLFHGPELTYLHAVGLMILAKLLVGHHGFGRGGHHRHHRHGPPWHRMKGLSEEERSKLREEFRHRCGH